MPHLRAAAPAALPAVERLLASADLPTAGVADLLATRAGDFVVADAPVAPGELAAVAGLEVCCENAPLRSVAVRPGWRTHGLGQALVRRVVRLAEERGVRALHLLTTTAEHYFPRFGFARIERGAVPEQIAATLEFTSAWPASATAVAKPLAGTAAPAR